MHRSTRSWLTQPQISAKNLVIVKTTEVIQDSRLESDLKKKIYACKFSDCALQYESIKEIKRHLQTTHPTSRTTSIRGIKRCISTSTASKITQSPVKCINTLKI